MGAQSCVIVFVLSFQICVSQITTFPFVERFDSVQAPLLPPGWETSTNRLAGGDFFTTATSPRSIPLAVQSTNSTIPQALVSPLINFTDRVPDQLRFYVARSSTHTSSLLIEASVDGGASYPLVCSDTLLHTGSTGYVQTILQLPGTLASQPTVRFRWRILGGTDGTSGTFRLDDVTLVVFTSLDISASSLVFQPGQPTNTDKITFTAAVSSRGVMPISGFRTDFFLDTNSDGRADQPELFASVQSGQLLPGASVFVITQHPPLPAGLHRVLAVVDLPDDENSFNDTTQVVIPVGVSPGSVIVNEIMYAPSGDEPEWVELYNPSRSTINLSGWRISDNRTTSKTLITSDEVLLQPSGYALVVRDSSFYTVHDSVLVSVAIAPFASLNNTTPDAVVIFDPLGRTIDSVFYDPEWGSDGRSLERIDFLSPSTDPSNWISSISIARSTPGRANSLALLDWDIRIESAAVFGITIGIQIFNAGRNTVRGFQVTVKTLSGALAGLLEYAGTLQPGVSAFLAHEWQEAPPGRSTVLIDAILKDDQRIENNRDTVEVTRGYPEGCLLINEIMYEPFAGQNEWIEVFNPGLFPVNLAGWSLDDLPTSSGSVNRSPLTSVLTVEPNEFAVIAADSSILTLFPYLQTDHRVLILNQAGGVGLSNSGDAVILKDLTGATIDSVHYSPSWHHSLVDDTQGRALERIRPDHGSNDPRNWSTSANPAGGSPARSNTIFAPSAPSGSSLSFSPNPFSPDGDGHEDFCVVRYSIPIPSSIIRIRIFDLRGREIRTLAEGEPAGSTGEVIWDGMESSRRKARIGPHIVFLEAAGNNGEIFTARGVVVVATAL